MKRKKTKGRAANRPFLLKGVELLLYITSRNEYDLSHMN